MMGENEQITKEEEQRKDMKGTGKENRDESQTKMGKEGKGKKKKGIGLYIDDSTVIYGL